MNLYILPVQRVLLEYVLKLGDMIFFPGDVSNEAIEYSNLLDDEKEKLRLIVEHNRSFFTEQLTGLPFLLLSSKYDISEINNDIAIFEKILNDANRRFDYIRILECPFNRPEYTIGIPGLIDGKRMLFSINDDYSIGAYINGEEEFYLMQKGIGLDLGVTENNDTRLYRVIYSHRNDEVYGNVQDYLRERGAECIPIMASDGLNDGYPQFYDFEYNADAGEITAVTELSVMEQAENLINRLEFGATVYMDDERDLIVNYAYKLDDMDKTRELAERLAYQIENEPVNEPLTVIDARAEINALPDPMIGLSEMREYG